MLPVAFFLTVILFVVLRLTPGDPAQVELGEQATPETIAALHRQLGLDSPLPVQYAIWVSHVLRGDLGRSLANSVPVRSAIGDRLPATLELGGVAFVLHLFLALLIGTVAAIYRRSLIGPTTTLFASVFVSLPGVFLRHPPGTDLLH